ncbi:unnamed protein product [Protopolystoma xenopodis]|uniref:Uncharacterized protein n=1 Tax=Protopolystoma xenopodis TaxID=117903 RepID=A0A448WTI3_9PLAT|nr:unnamed protein product [Protopolystoma xenopodis]
MAVEYVASVKLKEVSSCLSLRRLPSGGKRLKMAPLSSVQTREWMKKTCIFSYRTGVLMTLVNRSDWTSLTDLQFKCPSQPTFDPGLEHSVTRRLLYARPLRLDAGGHNFATCSA